jgi:cytochrome b involved in lipid metabolism
VYNVTPYAEYHPGGVPELMRAAGRDGSKLFGEVHPWVNYEGMLQACLVGIYVGETERTSMDDMD